MAGMEDPAFIPPVTSFFRDEDARSTGSSVTTPDVLTKCEPWSKDSNAYNKSLSPGCSVVTEVPLESEVPLSPDHTVLSAATEATEKFSVGSVSTVPKSAWSVVNDKVSERNVSIGSPESKTKPQLKVKECVNVGSVEGNTAARNSTRSAGSSLPIENLDKVNKRPGSTVVIRKTEKMSVEPQAKNDKSPGSTVISVVSEKASVAGTMMSALTEKCSVAGTKGGDEGTTRIYGEVSKVASQASALPPVDKKRPVTVKDFAATGSANVSVSSLISTLSIPELPKTSKKQPPVRVESPSTPKISNSKSSIKQNLSFSHPHGSVKPCIPLSRSMSPSLERSTIEKQALPNPNKKNATTSKQAVTKSFENIKSTKNSSSVDVIESAIIVTDTLSSTRAIVRGGSKAVKKEIPPLHNRNKTAGALIGHSQSYSYPQKKDKEQIAMSSPFGAIGKTEKEVDVSDKSSDEARNEASGDIPKTTLFKKALSFGSNSTKGKGNPRSSNDDGIRVFSGSSTYSVCSKGSSISSKNPASDTSTATSTLSKSSSEIISEGKISVASTECTRKMSNMGVKSTIKQSLSFTSPRKVKPPIHASRSMSPSLSQKHEDVPSIRTVLQHDVRETIDSSAAKDKSLPRAPSSQAAKQRREIITVVLEAERANNDDDSSIEVVSVPEVPAEKKTKDIGRDPAETNEGTAAASEDERSNSADSNLKRRQKILLGKLLRSRQERRKKTTSFKSHSTSVMIDKNCENTTPHLESVDCDNPLNTNRVNAAQNKDTTASRKSEMSSHSSQNFAAHLHVSDFNGSASAPQFVAKNGYMNEVYPKAHADEPIPITQIGFNRNHTADDTSLTLDSELSHKHKFKIWHEDAGYVEASSGEGFSCGGGGFKLHTDESCIDLSNIGDDFVVDDLSDDGRRERHSSPLAFCDDALGGEIVVEMKSAASQIYAGMKNATWSTARKLFGAFDITANGGVDYLADEVNATQQQLVTGTGPHNKSTRSGFLEESGVPTAQQALDEAVRQKLAQKKDIHQKKRYLGSSEHSLTRELTIVEKQEQARINREKEDLHKKKKHVQKLKSLALKHM